MMSLAERHPGRTFAIVGILFAFLYVGALTTPGRARVVNGDAIQYYAYLRSLVFDRDLDFANDYDALYGAGSEGDSVWLHGRTEIGRRPNLMSIGPALLWSPVYLAVLAFVAMAAAAGVPVAVDGFSAPFQLAAGVAGIAYATLGVYLCFLTVRLRYSQRAAFWGALVAWLATPAVYYTLVSPMYSHAVSIFTVALFTFIWLRSFGETTMRTRFVVLGALGGMAALVRWQDFAVVWLLPACELVAAVRHRRVTAGRALGLVAVTTTVAAVVAAPQFLAWRAIYGHFLVIPQGASFMKWTEPAVLSVLFSTRHGLLLWTPAVLLALAGLAWLWRRDGVLAASVVVAVTASIYVNAAVSDWWAGEAFGARRFVSDAVFFALGLAALGSALGARVRTAALRVGAVTLVAYNLLFLLQYQLFMRGYRDLAPYPVTLKEILVDRFVVPFRLIASWLDGSSG